ncbi:ferrous iron transport protein B [Paludibacterium paludis]|uniref:Ferrous iron transport protein B n=1 Tax=Paludibacterium paludis TaxID=1225769 RepID=A0A918NXM1_9NEIS|nr:ferrous iron transport protein B [Paludibacterium paludis]GGY05206.1 ferrous iron transport protein B [Paludibacterium paludis]
MKRFALIGFPNTGKSTLFNRLTGLSQRVGNWPGLTVELARARVLLGGSMVELVDLPGVNDLTGYSDDEAVVRDVLAGTGFDGLVLVLNVCQLDRQLPLAVQVIASGVPCLVVLNMADEARGMAVDLDLPALAGRLGVPVRLVSARRMTGWEGMMQALGALASRPEPAVRADLSALPAHDAAIGRAKAMLAGVWSVPPVLPPRVTEKVDRWLMHPWLGVPLFFLIMALVFNATYSIGKPLQDLVAGALDVVKDGALVPATAALPPIVASLLLDGVWQGVSTVLTFAPIIFVFFVLMALVEDSGYLARAAYLTDALMARLGLDGRGFVMQLMGFGCNVPAILGTRVMRDRGQRLLSMLIIPLSLCSARLQVVVFFASTLFSASVAPWVLTGMYVLSLLVAIFTAWVFRRRFAGRELFLLEVPPYRLPGARHLFVRAVGEVRAFLELASTFILVGVVMVWLLTHIPAGANRTLADALGDVFAPVLDPIGIRHELAVALLFGFVAKEILLGSMAVIYGVPEAGLGGALIQHLDWMSAMSFLLFTLIYVPCVSTISAIHRESRSVAFTSLNVGWSLLLAWVVSFVFYQTATHFFA